ncbi:723_t:CDS:2 [Ambispora gerdemannii]|uniref:723_t:CDS:1 n=1 Tax=Ambispora gerdemannii TaxID=144530 RepID=A0A9N9BHY4_9GLOM|nr:723_t:CDS:2 [Ambispora gerdemannii]
MLTGLEKQSLCIKVQKHPNITLETLAIEFGIKPNTVHDILAEKDIWLALDKNSPLATIESALALWVEHAIHHEQALTGEILNVKAHEFADKMNINDFKASPGWPIGEANSAPLENLSRFHNELQQLIQLYPIENVFNCDETALFYHLNSIKTLAHGPITGRKKAKDCVILMFTNQSISNIPQTNIREAIEFVRIAWNQVSTETITHAWQKMGIIPNNMTVENEEDVVSSTNMELIELSY